VDTYATFVNLYSHKNFILHLDAQLAVYHYFHPFNGLMLSPVSNKGTLARERPVFQLHYSNALLELPFVSCFIMRVRGIHSLTSSSFFSSPKMRSVVCRTSTGSRNDWDWVSYTHTGTVVYWLLIARLYSSGKGIGKPMCMATFQS
jgi:hypothetical protein